MQDVPRESLSRHLGFGKDDLEERDGLDRKLARKANNLLCNLTGFCSYMLPEHVRYVYNLQDGDSTTDESEDSEEWESDDSSASANWRRGGVYRSSSVSRVTNGRFGSQPPPQPSSGRYSSSAAKKRMSLITGKYFDVPPYESGFEHYDIGGAVSNLYLKASSAGPSSTRRRFFQSGAGKWDEEAMLSAVDARVEMSKEVVQYHVLPQDIVGLLERGGKRLDDDEEDDDDDREEVAMSVDS